MRAENLSADLALIKWTENRWPVFLFPD